MSIITDTIEDLKRWRPGELPNEKAYHLSLEAFLRKKHPQANLEREYRHNGTTIDIYFAKPGLLGTRHLFFELKRNLTKKGECDRLIGQVERMHGGSYNSLIVLCGRSDPRWVQRLCDRFKAHLQDDFLDFFSSGLTMGIILINSTETAPAQA